MERLDTIAPGLAGRLQAQPVAERRSRLARACEIASHSIFDIEAELKTWINDCVNRGSLTPSQITAARAFAESADEKYFAMEESGGDEKLWTNWFKKARLVSAIVYAFGGESDEDAIEAAYELYHVVDPKSESQIIETMDPGVLSSAREPVSEKGKTISQILPGKADGSVEKSLARQWQDRLQQYKACKTKAEVEARFGRPSRKFQEREMEIWIYELGVQGDDLYSIRAAFMDGLLEQTYIGIEPPH